VIVTSNLADFPAAELAKYDLEAQHPDEFVMHLIDLPRGPAVVVRVVLDQAADLRNPPMTPEEVLDTLERNGLLRSVARLRALVP
jgi:hypothetical protein